MASSNATRHARKFNSLSERAAPSQGAFMTVKYILAEWSVFFLEAWFAPPQLQSSKSPATVIELTVLFAF